MNTQEERRTRALDQTEDMGEPRSGLFAHLTQVGLGHTFNLQLNLPSRVSVLEAVMVHQGGGRFGRDGRWRSDGENGAGGFSLGFHLRRVVNGLGDDVDLSARFWCKPTRRTGLTRRNRTCVIWAREGAKWTTSGRWG